VKRRRVLIALTVLGAGTFIAWKFTHRHDPRLVGRWLMTYDERPAIEQDSAMTGASGFAQKTEWQFYENGTGEVHRNFPTVFSAQGWDKFRWWSNGGRLHIHWQEGRTGWAAIHEGTADLYRHFRGGPILHPVEEYEWLIEGPDEIRLEPKPRSQWRVLRVIYLTRLPEDES
jgi:hypothetical protein